VARLLAAEVDVELYRHLIGNEPDNDGSSSGHVFVEPELRALPEPQAIEELAIDYCRLFVGPMPLCPPYASARGGETLLGGRARRRLEEFLTRYELMVDMDAARVASSDHVAVELSVLAHIHGGTLSENTDPTVVAREFLRDHVLPWMPSYLEEVYGSAERALYRSVARLTAGALDEDRMAHGL
jgi:TorA maturation chaperone TorD